jgi:hypothetical protein
MGKYLTMILAIILVESCDQPPIYHAYLQTPRINGLTWDGEPFWAADLIKRNKEFTEYNFSMQPWYGEGGEPAYTPWGSIKPFSCRMFAFYNRVELELKSDGQYSKTQIIGFQFDLKPNTVIDSVLNIESNFKGYTKFVEAIEIFEDTLYKFEWCNILKTQSGRSSTTVFFISKTKGLCGIAEFCEDGGHDNLCSLGTTPGMDLPRGNHCHRCGVVE